MSDFVSLVKKAAVDAVEGGKPAGVLFGTVTGVSPLKVTVEQRLTLSGEMLLLTFGVMDYEAEVSVDCKTESDANLSTAHSHPCSGASVETASFDSAHWHGIRGRKKITVHNGLKVGEKVVLLRMQGGQKFLVLDRVREESGAQSSAF